MGSLFVARGGFLQIFNWFLGLYFVWIITLALAVMLKSFSAN